MTVRNGDILLVEDSDLTIRALRKSGVANEVFWVRSGAEALDFLYARGNYRGRDPTHLPQLVLLDLHLPQLDGLEVLKQLRSDPGRRLLPVVVLTSSTQDEHVVRSYELGVNSYVAKPVKFEDFAGVVEQLGMYWLLINRPPELPVVQAPRDRAPLKRDG